MQQRHKTRLGLMVCDKQLKVAASHFVQAEAEPEPEPAPAAHHVDCTASDTSLQCACRCCLLMDQTYVAQHGHLPNLLRSHSEGCNGNTVG